jgi:hypothetical protein
MTADYHYRPTIGELMWAAADAVGREFRARLVAEGCTVGVGWTVEAHFTEHHFHRYFGDLNQPVAREVFRFVRHRETAVDIAGAMNARGFDAEIWLIGGGRESHQRFKKGPVPPARPPRPGAILIPGPRGDMTMPDEKLRPPKGGETTPTQVRLTEEDKADLEAIRAHFGFWSRTDAIRWAIDAGLREIAGKPPEKKKRGKYQRPS